MMLRRWALRLVDERLVLSIIGLNMLILFLRAFPGMGHDHGLLWAIDYACTVYFVVEVVLKVRLHGWTLYWAHGLNRFDFVVVLISLPTLVTAFTSFEDLSVVLVLRAARLVRLFRVLRFIPHAEQLWAGIGRAVKASVGLIMMLVIFDFIIGLVACHLFRDVAPEHFGDPLTSVYTIFKVFTVEGWYEVPDAIAAGSHPANPMIGTLARGFFVVVVITGGLFGLGLTNAVLVDEMVLDNNDALEAEVVALRDELRQMRAEQSVLLERLSSHLGLPPPDPDARS